MFEKITKFIGKAYPSATPGELRKVRMLFFFYLVSIILTSGWIIFDSFSFPTRNNYQGELSLFGMAILGYYFVSKGQRSAAVALIHLLPVPVYFLFISSEYAMLPPEQSIPLTLSAMIFGLFFLLIFAARQIQFSIFFAVSFTTLFLHSWWVKDHGYILSLFWPDHNPYINPLFIYILVWGLSYIIFSYNRHAQEEAVDRLNIQQRRVGSILLQIPDGILHMSYIRDEQGQKTGLRMLRINPAFEDMFGVKNSEVRGRPASSVFQKIFRDKVDWQGIFLNGKKNKHEIYVPHMEKWYEISILHLDTDELIGMFSDVTAAKKTLDDLSSSRHRYKLLLETIPDIFFVIDKDGTYIDYVAKEEEGIEIAPDEIIGSSIFEVGFSERMVRQVFHSIQTVIKFDAIETIEYALDIPGRGTCLFEMRMVKLSDVAVMAVSRDITKRKLAEQRLEEAKKKAEEADRLKSAFLQNISHEVRTPMNAILGFSNMLIAEEVPKAERDKYLQLITKNGQTLLHLINDMIKLARIESGQIEIKKQFFSVNNLMVDLHRQFLYEKEQRGRKHLRLNISTGNDNPQFSIYSDGNKIRDVMENLLDNAVKFTHDGEIEFGYRLIEQNNIEFFVRDTGIGIPVDMHNDIFRRFHQLDNSLTREYGGTGIGLSVAQDFVDKLGSKLQVISETGKGSKFFFVIPIEAGNGFLRVV